MQSEQWPIQSVTFGVGDRSMQFTLGRPNGKGKVKEIAIKPGMPGFYILTVLTEYGEGEDESLEGYMVSPATATFALGQRQIVDVKQAPTLLVPGEAAGLPPELR